MCGEESIFDKISSELSELRKKTLDVVEEVVGGDVVECPPGVDTCPKTGKKCIGGLNSRWEKAMQDLSDEVEELEMKLSDFINEMF